MTAPFGEWIHKVIAMRTTVTIGEGEGKFAGTITAFDEQHGVVTFQAGSTSHYIPLTSIRSFGHENEGGATCYIELFKR